MKKKLLAGLTAVMLVGSSSLCFAAVFGSYTSGLGVARSPHNMPRYLQAKGAATVTSQLCIFCHTPHNPTATGEASYNPLWNHKLDTTGFVPYDGIDLKDPNYAFGFGETTFNALAGFVNPDPTSPLYDVVKGPTRLCMSCHDGVTAIDAYTKNGNGTFYLNYADDKKIMISENVSYSGVNDPFGRGAKDLRNDHPVGFSYKDVADGSALVVKDDNIRAYNVSVTTWLGSGVTSIDKIQNVLFKGEFMTCASCHDVHNTDGTSVAGGSFEKPLLRVKSEGSALCLMCHKK